ncbi:hypothetical protein C8R44DRAFT_781896 [Mycena epipterygia]|nr:hypothetical protein C8R44DRAFT_781896 [Mycena epipterygia]
MALAIRCGDSALSDIVLNAWEGLVRNSVNPAHLIAVLEQEELECFSGLTYYAQLSAMKLVRSGAPGSQTVTITGCDGLSETQISRFMLGRWSLSNEFDRLAKNPPALLRGSGCSALNHELCTLDWEKLWRDCTNAKTVLSVDSADLLGRLNGIKTYLENLRRVKMHSTCRPNMDAAVAGSIVTTKRHLGDHFQLPASGVVQ